MTHPAMPVAQDFIFNFAEIQSDATGMNTN